MLPPRPPRPPIGLRASSREGLRWRPLRMPIPRSDVLATEDTARDVGPRGRREGRRRSRPRSTGPPSVGASTRPARRRRSPVPVDGSPVAASTRLNLLWALLAAAVPWAWFLVRDLGSVDATGRARDPGAGRRPPSWAWPSPSSTRRRLSTLVVAVSVAAFGWVTILGPRSRACPHLHPSRRCGSRRWRSTARAGDAEAILRSVAGLKADLAIVVEPSKKVRNALRCETDRYAFALTSGPVVVLSSAPVRELPLPKGLRPTSSSASAGRPSGGRVHRLRGPRGRLAARVDAQRSRSTPTGCGRPAARNGCRSCSPETSDSATVPRSTAS